MPEKGVAVAVVANSVTDAIAVIAEGAFRLMTGREPRRSFPQIDRSVKPEEYQTARELLPRHYSDLSKTELGARVPLDGGVLLVLKNERESKAGARVSVMRSRNSHLARVADWQGFKVRAPSCPHPQVKRHPLAFRRQEASRRIRYRP